MSMMGGYTPTGASVPTTTKGDLAGYSTLAARVPVGADAQVLTADSSQTLGLKYATPVFRAIAQTVISVAAATIDFQSIPGTYEDLIVVGTARGDNAGVVVLVGLRANNDSAGNYDWRQSTYGSSVSIQSGNAQTSATMAQIPAAGDSAGMAGCFEILIPNYARTVFNKNFMGRSFEVRGSGGNGFLHPGNGGVWFNSAAINRLTLVLDAGNFDVGTVVTLYGRNSGN